MIRRVYLLGIICSICFANDYSRYGRVQGLDGKMCVNIQFTQSDYTPIKCAVLCKLDSNCILFFFIPGTNACMGCSATTEFQTPVVANDALAYGLGDQTFYIGCYVDGPNRVMNEDFMRNMSMTNELCSQYCTTQGFIYSGTQFRNECYCGNSNDAIKADAESECNSKCVGDLTQMCGGGYRLSISISTY